VADIVENRTAAAQAWHYKKLVYLNLLLGSMGMKDMLVYTGRGIIKTHKLSTL
jgi:hypothetical protein